MGYDRYVDAFTAPCIKKTFLYQAYRRRVDVGIMHAENIIKKVKTRQEDFGLF